MNIIRSTFCRVCRTTYPRSAAVPALPADTSPSSQRFLSSWVLSRAAPWAGTIRCGPLLASSSPAEAGGSGPWARQQVRTRKRGTEYQPKNVKRKRTHGWIKRISSRGGIEVILRRMLKGRKSLTH